MAQDLIQTTQDNLMKRSPNSGYDTMQGPHLNTSFGYVSDKIIPHNLGYPPVFRVFYEPWGDGKIMPAHSGSGSGMDNPPYDFSGAPAGPSVYTSADNNNLYITLYYTDGAKAANTYPVYWVIYEDYSLD